MDPRPKAAGGVAAAAAAAAAIDVVLVGIPRVALHHHNERVANVRHRRPPLLTAKL